MTPAQQSIFDRIQAMKAVLRAGGPYTFALGQPCTEKQYRASMAQLARSLSATDDRTWDVQRSINQPTDAAGRSRSCAFGRWNRDDE